MKRALLGLLVTALLSAGPAFAVPVLCTGANTAACDAIELGGGPYVKFIENGNRYIDLVNPFTLSLDITTPGVSRNAGEGTLATGVVRVFNHTLSTYQTGSGAQVTAQDVFTLTGPGSGPVTLTAVFRAEGTADVIESPNPGGLINLGAASLELCGPGGSFACGGDSFSRGGFPPQFVAYNGPITSDFTSEEFLERVYTFDVTIGNPFTMFYRLTAQTQNGSTIDMFNTGTLSFDVPDGYALTSFGGYGTSTEEPPPSGVPAPSTWMLVGLGLALLGARRRRSSPPRRPARWLDAAPRSWVR